jgi:epoxide hydrolase-like predicted phosphatase
MNPAIIFDFGGVFMKTLDYSPRHHWDDRLGLERGSVERIVHAGESWRAAQTGLITPVDYRADVGAHLKLEPPELKLLFEDYFSGDQLDMELVAYARALRERGYPVALLSNDSLELRPRLETLGIHTLFDPLVISAQIGVMKPDARAYQAVLDRIGCEPSQAIFIDDMPANIAGAEAVGLRGIRYRETALLRQDLETMLTHATFMDKKSS